jgi:hypothetical protein
MVEVQIWYVQIASKLVDDREDGQLFGHGLFDVFCWSDYPVGSFVIHAEFVFDAVCNQIALVVNYAHGMG